MRAGTIVLVAATVFGLGCWVGRLAKTGRWSSGAGRAHGAVGRAFPDARPLGARVAQMGGRATRFDAFFVRASVSAASERFGLSLEKMGAEIGRHQIGKTRIVRYTDRRGVTSYAIFSPGPKGNGCTVQIAHAPASAGGIERRGVPKTEPSDVPPPPSSQTLFHAAGGSKNPSTLSLLETTAGVEETVAHYRRTMSSNEWQENRKESVLLGRKGEGRFLAFEKPGAKCIIEVRQGLENRTAVTVIRFPVARGPTKQQNPAP